LKLLVISNLGFWNYGPRYEIFTRFAKYGHEVHYIYPLDKSSKSEPKIKNVFLYPVKIPFFDSDILSGNYAIKFLKIIFLHLLLLIRAIQVSKIVRPNIIYGYGEFCVIQAYLISRIFRIPFVIRLQGIEASKKLVGKDVGNFLYYHLSNLLLFPFLYEMIVFKIAKFAADAIIITNDGTQGDILARYFGVPREKLRFWFNGVNFGQLDTKEIDIKFIKSKFGIPLNAYVITTVSRLEKWKGVHRLIKAVPSIIHRRQDVVFLIIGDGSERKRLIQLAEDLGISKYVKFLGHVAHKEIEYLLAATDIFVTLQDISCLGENLLEAMKCGRCIVALNSGGTGILIRNNVNGILLDYLELPSLPNVILSLLADEDRRKKLGENARRLALGVLWTWDERAKAEIELIKSIVEKHIFIRGFY
jgi:glycosyltransferase involved in cell wall biosynthesis